MRNSGSFFARPPRGWDLKTCMGNGRSTVRKKVGTTHLPRILLLSTSKKPQRLTFHVADNLNNVFCVSFLNFSGEQRAAIVEENSSRQSASPPSPAAALLMALAAAAVSAARQRPTNPRRRPRRRRLREDHSQTENSGERRRPRTC